MKGRCLHAKCFEHTTRQVRIHMSETSTVACESCGAHNFLPNAHVKSSKVMRRCGGSVQRS